MCSPWVVPARTSDPPCFSVIAMPISALPFCSFGSSRGSYSREYMRGSQASAIHGVSLSEATAAWVIETGHAEPGSTCAKSMNIAARAACAPVARLRPCRRVRAARDGRTEHAVVRRVVLDLVEAESPAVVRVGDRGVHVGEARIPLEVERSDVRARFRQGIRRPPRPEGVHSGDERGVERELVDVHAERRLVLDVVGGRTDHALAARVRRHARSSSATRAMATCSSIVSGACVTRSCMNASLCRAGVESSNG